MLAKRLKQATYGSRQYNCIVNVSRQSKRCKDNQGDIRALDYNVGWK